MNHGASMKVLRFFTFPKDSTSANEDSHGESETGAICALSDGASISYDSARWSKLLCDRFANDPNVDRSWIQDAASEYTSMFDWEAMSWSQQSAFERGSFATLLGVVCDPEGTGARVFSIGDSMLAVVSKNSVVQTFPYVDSAQFDADPILVSTSYVANERFSDDVLSASWIDIQTTREEQQTLLLMTDALGRWLLDCPDETRVATLLNFSDTQAFNEFILRERASGALKRDDSTLIVVGYPSDISADR